MPLLSFHVVDGNSRSCLVAFAFVSNESSHMLKQNNPSSSLIKTFMVDKDHHPNSWVTGHPLGYF